MKIVQVIGGGEKGGSQNHVITLSKELRKKGIHVEIVCFMDDVVAKAARSNNIPLTIFPMKNIFDMRSINQFHQYLEKKNPDIVHTHGFRANFIGRIATRGFKAPVITTVHSSIYHDYSSPIKKNIYHRIEKLTRNYTNMFITVADSLKKELETDGIPKEKIKVVYNGLSPEFPLEKKVKPFLREELNIEADKPIVINIGRVEAVKNQQMLLNVFHTLKQSNIPFHGVIVGDGTLLPELKDQAIDLGIEENVSFLGFRKDIYELLSESDLFVLTSKMEGMPITLLEAMAAKTPVTVTNVGGMPEIVRAASNGYVVPPEDVEQFAARIQEILVQPELRERLAENGYKALLKTFTSEQFILNTLEVYNEALAQAGDKGVNP